MMKILFNFFSKGTEIYEKLQEVLLRPHLLKAIKKPCPFGNTSGLEGYHSTVIQFAPKIYHLGYDSMTSSLVPFP